MMPESGYCKCGCGGMAPMAKRSRPYLGHIEGQPVPYILGHNTKWSEEKFWMGMRLVPSGVLDSFCWEWQGGVSIQGYGECCRIAGEKKAHRVAYVLLKGEIPKGMQVDHLCRNRLCMNPNHLEAVSAATNSRRSSMTKLTSTQAEVIRVSLAGPKVLGQFFGVSPQTVCNVRAGRSWL